MAFKKTLLAFVELARPLEWSKTFGNMVIAAIIASGFSGFDWLVFLAGFLAVGPFLWGGLYALNDWTDGGKDKKHSHKKLRPIPSGRVSPKGGLLFSLSLILIAFAIAFALNNFLFLVFLLAMLLNQLLYTMKPFELKKKPFFDLVSGSLVNPFFRFYSGWVLVQQNFSAPIEIIGFILGVQFGGFVLYRMSSKEHEKEMEYKSSVVLFGEKNLKIVSYAALAFGGFSYIYASLSGVLPLKFVWLVLLSLLALPLYWTAITKPQAIDMGFMYKLIYIHYSLFILGFLILSYVV